MTVRYLYDCNVWRPVLEPYIYDVDVLAENFIKIGGI